jgi:recombinational DNA repair protein RecT
MADESKTQNQIATLDQKIQKAKNVKELFSLPDVKERFIKNYEAVTGRKDGENRLEQERFAYLQLMADKPDLAQVDKFYHFSALVYAGTTGLSFRNNRLYVYPNGKGGLTVKPSPAGKREMLEMMSNVEEAPEAILVMKGDKFVHDKLNGVVKVHETTEKSESKITLDNIVASYQRIYFKGGKIRDTVVYHDDLVKAKSKSKVKSEDGNWGSFPGEMSKKTATNRAYDRYHKFPDNVVLYGGDEEKEVTDDVPHMDVTPDYPEQQESFEPNTGKEQVDYDTGEVHDAQVVTEEQKKPRKTKNLLDED